MAIVHRPQSVPAPLLSSEQAVRFVFAGVRDVLTP